MCHSLSVGFCCSHAGRPCQLVYCSVGKFAVELPSCERLAKRWMSHVCAVGGMFCCQHVALNSSVADHAAVVALEAAATAVAAAKAEAANLDQTTRS